MEENVGWSGYCYSCAFVATDASPPVVVAGVGICKPNSSGSSFRSIVPSVT